MCKHKRISLRDASLSRILATKRADHARLYFVHRYYPERAGRFSHCQDYRFQLRIRSWIRSIYIHAHEYGADVRGSRSEQGSEESQTRVLQTFSPEVEGFMEGKSNYFFRKIIYTFVSKSEMDLTLTLSLSIPFSLPFHTFSLSLSLSFSPIVSRYHEGNEQSEKTRLERFEIHEANMKNGRKKGRKGKEGEKRETNTEEELLKNKRKKNVSGRLLSSSLSLCFL